MLAIGALSLHHLAANAPAAPFQAQASAIAPNGVLFYNKDKAARAEVVAAINDKTLLGWAPLLADFENPPANILPKPDLSKHTEDAWAFYHKGRMVASGPGAPTAEELEAAYLKAGIPNRAQALKEFVLKNPTNMNGRSGLMNELFSQASQKTAQTLNLAQKDAGADTPQAPDGPNDLDEDADENIWGDFADLFETSFAYRNWLSVLPGVFGGMLPGSMAAHSPIMKALYKKNLPLVESELENRQADLDLWTMWIEMALATGRKGTEFFPRIPTMPMESGHLWSPPIMARRVREDTRPACDWPRMLEEGWPQWPRIKSLLDMVAPYNKMPEMWHGDEELRDLLWERKVLPLLEACLYNRAFSRAAQIYNDMARRPAFEREAGLAYEAARAHGHTFQEIAVQQSPAPPEAEPEVEDTGTDDNADADIEADATIMAANRLKDLAKWKWFSLVATDQPTGYNKFAVGNSRGNPNSVIVGMIATWSNSPRLPVGTMISLVDRRALIPESEWNPEGLLWEPIFPEPPPTISRTRAWMALVGSVRLFTGSPNPSEALLRYQRQHTVHTYFQDALSQDKLMDYDVFPYIVQPDSPIVMELAKQAPLPSSGNKFFWGLLDGNGKYRHGGSSMPTAETILELLQSTKKETRLEAIKKHSKLNPGSITAKSILLEEMQRVAVIRTNNAPKQENDLLSSDDDKKIWGGFNEAAEAALPEILSRPDEMFIASPFNIPVIKNSRLLQRFAAKHIYSIEYALQGRPHSKGLWELWGAFSPYVPNKPLQSFLYTLTPVPGVPDFPPESLYPAILGACQSLSAWTMIIALLEPIWEAVQGEGSAGWNNGQITAKKFVERYLDTLCYAYEKNGQGQKAERARKAMK
jgi:hypothetical protein